MNEIEQLRTEAIRMKQDNPKLFRERLYSILLDKVHSHPLVADIMIVLTVNGLIDEPPEGVK